MAKKQFPAAQEPLFVGLDLDRLSAVETIHDEAAEKYSFDTVDFNDPQRPKTCLEVDFPILRVNEVAALEAEPPCTKPIFKMSKWWARRRSSIFRQLLISAVTKAPAKIEAAAQTSWALMYRKSHLKHGKFKHLKIADIFMGGGTTVLEAARLGAQVIGIDLNPIAWWVVKNETTPVSPEKIQKFADYIEAKVKPQIMRFYATESPRGFKGVWINTETSKESDIDPLKIKKSDLHKYKWQGSEIIYTFWMKHIMCADPACFHLTPQASSAVVAQKSVKVKTWKNCVCPKCGDTFDLEASDFRMAPNADFSSSASEEPFAAIDLKSGNSKCPHCKAKLDIEWIKKQQDRKGKPISKEVNHVLLLPKKWLKGVTAKSKTDFGGYFGSSTAADEKWFKERAEGLRLLEVRGEVPEELKHTSFSQKAKSSEDDEERGSSGSIQCGKCGRVQDPLSSIKLTGHLAPVFPYMVHGFDPEAKAKKYLYQGRFFATPNLNQILASFSEYANDKSLHELVPPEELFYGYKTHHWGIPDHGYTHWYKMFNPRQLYIHALLLKTIMDAPEETADRETKSQILGAFQNYLRHNCMFAFWHIRADQISPLFSNNNYPPKATAVENSVFADLGVGTFRAFCANAAWGMEYLQKPYDLRLSAGDEKGKTQKEVSKDSFDSRNVQLLCRSSTDLRGAIDDSSVDCVVTDPPFGDNINYAELADFFMVWLAKPLGRLFPEVFTSSESPKALEAVTNKARHKGKSEDGQSNADLMYQRLLTLCWKESYRILKPGGILTFTFHHDKDVAWIGVLESLFSAGFYIEAAFPVRSDGSKGDGQFGAQKIEYDIVHVCRKRLEEPKDIYWATLRKNILDSVKNSAVILAQHRISGLHLADLEVIIRGKVLEQYSKHYGKVKKNLAGDLMEVKEILTEANLIALRLLQSQEEDRIPENVEADTRVFFGLLREGQSIERNAASKRLKGSGVTVEDLEANGWIITNKIDGEKIVKLVNPVERWNSLSRKAQIKKDLDQVHFAINCCIGGKMYKDKAADWESWIVENYKTLLPSVGPILKFIEGNHFGSDFKQSIGVAYRTLERTLQKLKDSDGAFKTASEQMSLFGAEETSHGRT